MLELIFVYEKGNRMCEAGISEGRKSRYFAGIFQYREQMISVQRSSPSAPLSRVMW